MVGLCLGPYGGPEGVCNLVIHSRRLSDKNGSPRAAHAAALAPFPRAFLPAGVPRSLETTLPPMGPPYGPGPSPTVGT